MERASRSCAGVNGLWCNFANEFKGLILMVTVHLVNDLINAGPILLAKNVFREGNMKYSIIGKEVYLIQAELIYKVLKYLNLIMLFIL
jgi:hypothetical protein